MALSLSGGARAGAIFALAANAESEGHSAAKAEAASRSATAASPARQAEPWPAGGPCGKRDEHRRRLDTFDRRRRSGRGRSVCRRRDQCVGDRKRSLNSAGVGHGGPLCRVSGRSRRRSSGHHHRQAQFCRAGSGSASFGMPDRRRIWLSAMRLWRPASARAHAPGRASAAASFCTWPRKAAALVLRTRCEPIDCRTRGSIRATPTRCSASRTMSATMELRRSCCEP